jgi:hypothetical protein
MTPKLERLGARVEGVGWSCQREMVQTATFVLASVVVGAVLAVGLVYTLDPHLGRRRAEARERVSRIARKTRDAAARDLASGLRLIRGGKRAEPEPPPPAGDGDATSG